MKNKPVLLLLVLIVALSCVCACDNGDTPDNNLPEGAVEINIDNFYDYFKVYNDSDYDFSNNSASVTLKVAFVPKFNAKECHVEIEYTHDAKWDSYNGMGVVNELQKKLISSAEGLSAECYGYNQKPYYVKNNTVTICAAKGYVVKSSQNSFIENPAESGTDELRAKLAAFSDSFAAADEVSYVSKNRTTLTDVFDETKVSTLNQKLCVRRSTFEYNVLNTDRQTGHGTFVKGGNAFSETLSADGIMVAESEIGLIKVVLEGYSESLTPYRSTDKFGRVEKTENNVYTSKTVLSNVSFSDDGLSLAPSSYYGFTASDYSKFEVFATYTFGENSLTVSYTANLFEPFETVKTYRFEISRTYVIGEEFERLVDSHPMTAQQDAQTALDFYKPFEIASTKSVVLNCGNFNPSWVAVEFEKGMYVVSAEGGNINVFETDGKTFAVESPEKPTLLDGLYLLRLKTDYDNQSDKITLNVEKKNWQSLPDYDNPSEIASDGEMSGSIEGYGDEEVYRFVADETCCYVIRSLLDGYTMVTVVSQDGKEAYVYPSDGNKLIMLEKGEYTFIVGTNYTKAEKFDYRLVVSKFEHQPDPSAVLTAVDSPFYVFVYRTMEGGTELFYATFTVRTKGIYKFVVSDPDNVEASGVWDDEGNQYYADRNGYTLEAGTYKVGFWAYKNAEVNMRYEFVDYSNLNYVAWGDSITYGVDGVNGGRMENPYPTTVSEALGLKSFENRAVSGATFCSNTVGRENMTANVLAYTEHADIVSVMLGVNDFAANMPLGTSDDKTNSTIYGSLYLMCEHFKTYYADSFVFFMTPFPYRAGTTKNSEGYLLEDVAEAIKVMADKYNYPVLDMLGVSGYETEMNSAASDGLHPSQQYFDVYGAPKIIDFIKQNYA